ncbi:MAG: hypothetical protein K5879_04315 [Lachnospiraceae bacterium]|nr:hypothetical protein [Lachnospiraceae bacterium]
MDTKIPNDMPGEENSGTFQKNFMHYRATRLGTTFFFVALVSFLFQTIIFPFLFAPLSIFFAYLAKGKRKKNDWYNNFTIFFSTLILILNLVFCGYCVYSVSHDTMLHKKYDEVSYQVYGVSFDEYMKQIQNAVQNPTEYQNSLQTPAGITNPLITPGGDTNE